MLASTTLVAGVLAIGAGAMPSAALAVGLPDCGTTPDFLCDSGDSASGLAFTLTPGGSFRAQFGPDSSSPFTWNDGDPVSAVTIDAGGNVTKDDGVHFFSGSYIYNEDGVALTILDPGYDPGAENSDDGVVVNIDPTDPEANYGALYGSTGLVVRMTRTGENYVGKIHINNNGSIFGSKGYGIDASGFSSEDGLIFELQNHSYNTIFGTNGGAYVHSNIVYADIDNGKGLILGEKGPGVDIYDVHNTFPADGPDENHPAVSINNSRDGIIGSLTEDGIRISQVHPAGEVGNPNVFVNNDAYYDSRTGEFVHGGLIFGGEDGNGVTISDVEGRFDGYEAISEVSVNNAGTLGDAFDFSKVGDGEPEFAFLSSHGIFGGEDGVHINNVSTNVNVNNGSYVDEATGKTVGGGLIVGLSGDAVHIANVGAGLDPNVNVNNADGLMWGGNDGVHIWNVFGHVQIDNTGGTIFGVDEGVHVAKVQTTEDGGDGGVDIHNAGGRIEGFYGDGIHVWNAIQANVWNGDFSTFWDDGKAPDGGAIFSADSAIHLHTDNAFVANGTGGVIIGDGSYWQPVIDFRTNNGNDENGAAGAIFNLGLMSSDKIPHFLRGWDAPDPIDVPASPFDAAALASVTGEVNSISSFVWNGGQGGTIDSLLSYQEAASDVLLKSRGGATYLENHGIMIGRVNERGQNNTEDGWDNATGNTVVNLGTWLTTNLTEDGDWYDSWGNRMHGSANDEIQNAGLIQIAFDGLNPEYTSFEGVNRFFNGGHWANGEFVPGNGLVSLIDGGTGDALSITHQFLGSAGADRTSFIGLDTNFGPGAGPESFDGTGYDGMDSYFDDPSTWRSDRFLLGDSEDGSIAGTTGLIIHMVGTTPTNRTGDTIVVGYSPWDDNPESQQCFDRYCKDGDTLYIASPSQGYANVDGIGAIQDGLYAWYLKEVPGEDGPPDPAFVMQSEWGPRAVQLAGKSVV